MIFEKHLVSGIITMTNTRMTNRRMLFLNSSSVIQVIREFRRFFKNYTELLRESSEIHRVILREPQRLLREPLCNNLSLM